MPIKIRLKDRFSFGLSLTISKSKAKNQTKKTVQKYYLSIDRYIPASSCGMCHEKTDSFVMLIFQSSFYIAKLLLYKCVCSVEGRKKTMELA